MILLRRLNGLKPILMGGLLLLLVPLNASAGEVEDWVLLVSEEFSRAGTNQRIELIYKRLDIYALAEEVYPTDFWIKADPNQQRGLVAFLACRIASKMPGGRATGREILGVRHSGQRVTVAIRLVDSNRRQETLQFEIVSRSGGYMIRDVPLGKRASFSPSKKSYRLGWTSDSLHPPDPDGFLAALACPEGSGSG